MIQMILPVIGTVLDRILPDTEKANEAKAELSKMALQGELDSVQKEFEVQLAQIRVNEKAAEHGDIFVSGGRPFFIWVCGGAFAYTYLVRDFILLLAHFGGVAVDPTVLPQPNLSEMMPVALGLLGLGGLRSYEKVKGVARSKL